MTEVSMNKKDEQKILLAGCENVQGEK